MKVEMVPNLQRQATKILAELRDSEEAALITAHSQRSTSSADAQDYEVMQSRLALLAELFSGELAILEGRTTSHSKAKARMQKWLK